MKREEILEMAKILVCGARAEDYGDAKDNFNSIAMLWTEYTGHMVTPTDVAMMMILLKIARMKTGTFKEDTFIDIAGYAALAGELAEPIGDVCK